MAYRSAQSAARDLFRFELQRRGWNRTEIDSALEAAEPHFNTLPNYEDGGSDYDPRPVQEAVSKALAAAR